MNDIMYSKACLIFENFSLLPLKTADLEAVGNFYPAPCRIGLGLSLSSINPILHGLFSGSFVLPQAYEDTE